MLDLLAAISSVDPPALLAWLVLAFAAGMYPIGVMLGSNCSPCCGCNGGPGTCETTGNCAGGCVCVDGRCVVDPCTQCTEGELPETLTVTFDGLADQTPGADLITLSFAACYGGGVAGKVTAPGGDRVTDKGPISAVSLTDGGSGYAKLGRVAPTLTVSGGSGTGATFTPSLSTSQDACDLDLWALQSVAASGGTGYEDGDTLTITAAAGDTEVSAAAVTLYLDKTEPTLTLSGGATATVTMAAIGDGNYRISAVAVTSGGTGYSENQLLSFSVGANDVTLIAAYNARARVVHDTPANALLYEEGSGSGAVLTPVWTLLPSNQWPAPHRKTYYLSAVTITNGGSGYSIDDLLQFYFASNDDGQEIEGGTIFVDAVDGSGAITAVFITDSGGRYVGSRTDALHSVGITSGGSYYHDDPGARRVVVDAGGSYYREDASVAPYVATVTVSIAQVSPSAGTGASLSVTIDDDTSSETFGEITGITIDDGGDDYLAHEMFDTCLSRFDGRSIVLTRSLPAWPNILPFYTGPCVYRYVCQHDLQCSLEVEWAVVRYIGPDTPMRVIFGVYHPHLDGVWRPQDQGVMTADELSPDCSDIDVTATGGENVPEGATAHVAGGGEYEETATCAKISQQDIASSQVTINWAGKTWVAFEGAVEKPCDLGDINFSVNYCGIFSSLGASGHAGSGGRWADELLPNPSAPNDCGSFGQEWIATVFLVINNTCDRYWNGSVEVTHRYYWRSWFFGPGPTGTRDCTWTYQIVDVPIDEDGMPSGQITLGTPQFTQGDSWGSNFPLHPDQEIYPYYPPPCSNPGTPTISIAVMP